jgi:hypothetical protein
MTKEGCYKVIGECDAMNKFHKRNCEQSYKNWFFCCCHFLSLYFLYKTGQYVCLFFFKKSKQHLSFCNDIWLTLKRPHFVSWTVHSSPSKLPYTMSRKGRSFYEPGLGTITIYSRVLVLVSTNTHDWTLSL